MKALAALSVAIAAIALPSALSAQTRVIKAHGGTAPALLCLLDANRKGCRIEFVGSASLPARSWLWWSLPDRDFKLGALESAEYVGSQSNAYTTKFVGARTADVYHVKFRHQEKTFYIAPPDPDGKIHYMLIRGGAPDDERREGFAVSRIR